MRIMPLTLVRIVLALSILSMQGCAGVMVVANQTATRENPAISSCKGLIADLVAESPIPVTELLNHWGAPDRSERISLTREKWTYNLGIRFNGLILGVGVAIPLCVPVGHHYIAFTVENGNVILAEAKHSQFYGAMCNGVYCNSKSKLEDNALPERLTEYHKSRLLNLPWNTIEPANPKSLYPACPDY